MNKWLLRSFYRILRGRFTGNLPSSNDTLGWGISPIGAWVRNVLSRQAQLQCGPAVMAAGFHLAAKHHAYDWKDA
jgi:hypothetical protein